MVEELSGKTEILVKSHSRGERNFHQGESRVGKNASTVLDHECAETRELVMTCLRGLTGGWTVWQAAFDVMVVNDNEIVHSFETIPRDRR